MEARNSPAQAWLAYDNQQYDLAGKLWQSLLQQTVHPGEHSRYRLNYTFVLRGQHKYQEALAILEELFDASEDPLYLHGGPAGQAQFARCRSAPCFRRWGRRAF